MTYRFIIPALAILAIAACSARRAKKSGTPGPVVVAAPPVPTRPAVLAKPDNGIYAPGEQEVAAIGNLYPGTSLQTLSEGHSLYVGQCTQCHAAKNIYLIPDDRWPAILANMASAAKFSPQQTEAVNKYVLSVKAARK